MGGIAHPSLQVKNRLEAVLSTLSPPPLGLLPTLRGGGLIPGALWSTKALRFEGPRKGLDFQRRNLPLRVHPSISTHTTRPPHTHTSPAPPA